jgi:hypothetical protein
LGLDKFLEKLLRPTAIEVLQELKLDSNNFTMLVKSMRYVLNEDWPRHCDGDLATINFCLGGEFSGGSLTFVSRETKFEYAHNEIGTCCFHDGKYEHQVGAVTKGVRIALIIKLCKARE